MDHPKTIFPVTVNLLQDAFPDVRQETALERIPHLLDELARTGTVAPYLVDLARLELALYRTGEAQVPEQVDGECLQLNPTLQMITSSWSGLKECIEAGGNPEGLQPASETILIWKHPRTGEVHFGPADNPSLLALKVVAEELDPRELAHEHAVPVGIVDGAISGAVNQGLVLQPHSRLVRKPPRVSAQAVAGDPDVTATTFTLQWHITQRCDLNCRHCYDRTDRNPLSLDRGLDILDQFRTFCRRKNVTGQVSFTGGNPMLHPDFDALYRAAFERHLQVGILGNPMPRQRIEKLLEVVTPALYQVSLEGLPEHNDAIRGAGHFQRVMDFLDLLRELGVPNQVMLTLTRANMDQVLPLAGLLENRTDRFFFNRLALFGEGARLALPEPEDFAAFCHEYVRAAADSHILGLKDNLLNIPLDHEGKPSFGGCTGFGCGAAFNFIALLSDEEVHACRKFPSPIGNLRQDSLEAVYDGAKAEAYRQGCQACRDCRLFSSCGGCLAVTAGLGLDPLQDRDPFCPGVVSNSND